MWRRCFYVKRSSWQQKATAVNAVAATHLKHSHAQILIAKLSKTNYSPKHRKCPSAGSGCDRRRDAQRFVSDGPNSNAEVQSKGSGSVPVTREWIVVVCISWRTAIRNKNILLRTSLLLGNVLAWTKCVNIKMFPRLCFYVSVTLLPLKSTEDKTCRLWRALRLFVDAPASFYRLLAAVCKSFLLNENKWSSK